MSKWLPLTLNIESEFLYSSVLINAPLQGVVVDD